MHQRLVSLLILAAAPVLPVMARAGHRAWPKAGSETALSWAHRERLILVQQGRRKGSGRGDHDPARDAVNAGKILPLQQILQQTKGR
ncbi:MAG: hypothetical protein O2967_00905 [Proteobacteria bacterium]|nr:hypothetical protein [Pseudomonadota bacterium]